MNEPGRQGRIRRLLKAFATDTTPLRVSRDFRLLWTGEIITVTGQQVTFIALFLQIYSLTGSPAALGLLGLVEFVPLMLGTTIGGPLLDRNDRRRVLMATQSSLGATTGILLYTAVAAHPPLWLVYAAAGIASFISGIDVPCRNSAVPRLVDRSLLQPALALNIVMWNIAVIAGPAIGGVVIGTLGLRWAYALNLSTYAVTLAMVWMMRPIPPQAGASDVTGWESLKEGWAYLKGRRVLQSSFTIDLFAMVFGLPEALFPVLVVTQFGGKAAETGVISGGPVVGALLTSVAIGALIASVSNGWTRRVRHQGRAVVWMVILWGAAITVFGLAGDRLLLACVLLAVAGAADTISAVFRMTILQSSVPDELRGRLTSIHFAVVSGGPRLGNLESGMVAQVTSPLIAVVSGGVICLLGAVGVALFVPEFWRFHAGGET